VEKRLINIFLNRTQIEDPYFCEKGMRNLRAAAALSSKACKNALNKLEAKELGSAQRTLTETREMLRFIELKRLLALTAETSLWIDDNSVRLTESDYCRLLKQPVTGDGAQALFDFLGISGKESTENPGLVPKKILWMADESGEIMVDLVIIRLLARLGHKIILCFKEGPVYTKVDFEDAHSDETLNSQLEKGYFIRERNLGKNELVDILRSDNNIIIISDGTRENINLLLASTTFARLFKEVDGVISRGPDQKRRFFGSHFQFTQNIFNIAAGADNTVMVSFKSRHPAVIKYTYKDLEVKAKSIIEQMHAAKKKDMTVMFYSGIIGSIPGKLETAKKIMSVFVDHLRREYAMTFIINPSDYFEEGMDADDLMYMWEIVQRSGFIDIWRFQTYEDIVQAFRMIKSKVPPEWVGKDATFSTGCTKEMKIALDVQRKHPEMQIAGPAKEKFMRRSEYGVGMLYDQRLADICQG
jgi:Damage-control phosphatase ARMT1-like domain